MTTDLGLLWYSFDENTVSSVQLSDAKEKFFKEFSLSLAEENIPAHALHNDYGVHTTRGTLALWAPDFQHIIHPEKIAEQWLSLLPAHTVILINTHFSHARSGIGVWKGTELQRSFSADVFEIYENVGLPLVVEKDFWAGNHPVVFEDGVTPVKTEIPFHPAHLAEEIFRLHTGISNITGIVESAPSTPHSAGDIRFNKYCTSREQR